MLYTINILMKSYSKFILHNIVKVKIYARLSRKKSRVCYYIFLLTQIYLLNAITSNKILSLKD